MAFRILLVLLLATLFPKGIGLAQPHTGNEVTTVVYPVSDLVVPIDAHRKAEKIATSENELMAHLRKKVAPGTWEQAGGPGSMRYEEKGYCLHVRQTAKAHAELKSFLAQLLREQVSIEVRIVTVSESTLDHFRGAWALQWAKKDGIESALLDEARTYRFLEAVQGDRNAHVVQLPKITLFDGQDATLSAGARVRLLPTVSTDRRYVTVQAEINQPSPTEGDLKTQLPQVIEINLAIVAKVPNQRTVAILAGSAAADVVHMETSAPLLSRIPYVSRLVRNVGYSRESQKVIVLLTPRIVREEESMEAVDVRPLRTPFAAEDNGKFPLILPQRGK